MLNAYMDYLLQRYVFASVSDKDGDSRVLDFKHLVFRYLGLIVFIRYLIDQNIMFTFRDFSLYLPNGETIWIESMWFDLDKKSVRCIIHASDKKYSDSVFRLFSDFYNLVGLPVEFIP